MLRTLKPINILEADMHPLSFLMPPFEGVEPLLEALPLAKEQKNYEVHKRLHMLVW